MDLIAAIMKSTPPAATAMTAAGVSAFGAGAGIGSGSGETFGAVLKTALGQGRGRATLESVLAGNKLGLPADQDTPFSFMKGFKGAAEVAAGLDLARASLPASYKKQVGLGLMAMGREGSTANSMAAGAGLMGCRSSAEALKGLLASLGAERGLLKLDKDALPALGQALADSGVDEESIDRLLSEISAGDMTLDDVFFQISKLDLKTPQGSGGLTATSDGLPALGQFLGSLGASTEIIEKVTSGFQPGEQVTAAALRQIIGSGDDGFLTPVLGEGDARSLASMLKSMGATDEQLNSLSNLLVQTEGKLSMNGFLDFIQGLETAPAKTVTSQELALVKTIMENISREQQLAKTPVFDETLTKLQALGDREVDDDFMNLSPALQALRGGISAMSQNASLGGQPGQGGQNGQSGQRDDREAQKHYRQALHAAQGTEPTPAAAIEAAEVFQGYGGQESLARQISQKMAYSRRRGIHRLRMNLNPENMGRLDIELNVKGGQLTAHIRAENREAYEALAGDIDELKKNLAENGLEIGNLVISLGDQASGSREFADLGQAAGRAKKVKDAAVETASAEPQANARDREFYQVV